ncbi:hypothetical protein F5Y03DRAFT_378531 [Xylaria venustula]|nr:hypothetical protein F5Y03DRAFT_378531 [Xylaria venustula]
MMSGFSQTVWEGAPNVEDNIEAPLLGHDLDSRTPLWQHDNAWIRLPAQFIRAMWLIIKEQSSLNILFLLVLAIVGILLSISISTGNFPLVLIMIESCTAIAWAIYSRVTQ